MTSGHAQDYLEKHIHPFILLYFRIVALVKL